MSGHRSRTSPWNRTLQLPLDMILNKSRQLDRAFLTAPSTIMQMSCHFNYYSSKTQCWPQYEKYDIPNIGGSKYCRNIGLDILYYRDIKVPISYCSAIYCQYDDMATIPSNLNHLLPSLSQPLLSHYLLYSPYHRLKRRLVLTRTLNTLKLEL